MQHFQSIAKKKKKQTNIFAPIILHKTPHDAPTKE